MRLKNIPKKPLIVAMDESEKLDTCGTCITLNWRMLKGLVDKRIHIVQKSKKKSVRQSYAGDEVVKFVVTNDGLTVYFKNIHSVGDGIEFYNELVVEK